MTLYILQMAKILLQVVMVMILFTVILEKTQRKVQLEIICQVVQEMI